MQSSHKHFLSLLAALAFLLIGFRSESAPGRAVSMKVLEYTLKNAGSKQAESLCGITQLSGFIIDSSSKDIILVGKVDSSYPELLADDFIVALRAAHLIYGKRKGNTIYITPPGCSIDPDPAVLRQLDSLQRRGTSKEARQAYIEKWETIGRQPQKVRVLGVPFDTHFAKVMVDADYYMKRLSNGSVDLGIPGFAGTMEKNIARAKKELELGLDTSEPENSLNRFWFCPGLTEYEDINGLILLRSCQVKLLTEEEFLTVSGEVKGLGRPSPIAKEFAESFTRNYRAIAEARPIYKELENLFRMAAVANLMKEQKALAKSRNPMNYLLREYKVRTVPVSRYLPGLTRVVELEDVRETDYGVEARYITLMSCGGVNMNIRPKKIVSISSKKNGVESMIKSSKVSRSIVGQRPSQKALYWDCELPD